MPPECLAWAATALLWAVWLGAVLDRLTRWVERTRTRAPPRGREKQ